MREFFVVVPTIGVAAIALTGCFHEDWGHGASHGGGHAYVAPAPHGGGHTYVAPAPVYYAHRPPPPHDHAHWVEGRWVQGEHGNVWVPAHWEDN